MTNAQLIYQIAKTKEAARLSIYMYNVLRESWAADSTDDPYNQELHDRAILNARELIQWCSEMMRDIVEDEKLIESIRNAELREMLDGYESGDAS